MGFDWAKALEARQVPRELRRLGLVDLGEDGGVAGEVPAGGSNAPLVGALLRGVQLEVAVTELGGAGRVDEAGREDGG